METATMARDVTRSHVSDKTTSICTRKDKHVCQHLQSDEIWLKGTAAPRKEKCKQKHERNVSVNEDRGVNMREQ